MANHRSPHTPSMIPAQPKRSAFASPHTLIPGSARRQSMSIGSNNSNPSIAVAASPTYPRAAPTTPAGSGIPSFRSLRSLLPFGPNKHATPVSVSVSPNTSSRSPFASFGSVRRSMTKERERNASLSNDALMPVIAIERSKSDSQIDDTSLRRSASLSRLDIPLPPLPISDSPLKSSLELTQNSLSSAPILRTPSPGLPLSLELSTIIEADSSGVSKHIPILNADSSSPQPETPSPTLVNPNFLHAVNPSSSHSPSSSGITTPDTRLGGSNSDCDADTSMLDLSPAQLTRQVMDAMRATDASSVAANDWLGVDKAIIIDADAADSSFSLDVNLSSVDQDLVALLSPNSVVHQAYGRKPQPNQPQDPQSSPSSAGSPSRLPQTRQASSFLPRLRNSSKSPANSPTTPRFPTTPITPVSNVTTPQASPSKGQGEVESSEGYDPSSSSPSSPALPTSTPAAARRSLIGNPSRLFSPTAASSLSASAGARVFGRDKAFAIGKGRPPLLRQMLLGGSSAQKEGENTASPTPPVISLSSPPSPSRVSALGRGSLDSRRSPVPSNYSDAPRRPSLDVSRPSFESTRRPSLEIPRGASVSASTSTDKRTRRGGLFLSRSSASPERPPGTENESLPPLPDSRDDGLHNYRPSLDSTATRPSLDSTRSTSVVRIRERQRTPSLRVKNERPRTAGERLSPIPRGSTNQHRSRKRSMSVQDRLGVARLGGNAAVTEFGASRPGSSMSMGYGSSRARLGDRGEAGVVAGGDSSGGVAPKADWLTLRTSSKAFRAAGLLDHDREHSDRERESDSTERERNRDRSGSLSVNVSTTSTVLAPSPLSGGNNHGRFASVRATSEYNPSHGRAHSRMAFSEAGGSGRRGSGSFSAYGGAGLMESPTFTGSSGSRDGRDRDTPRSTTSTAMTSVSALSFGYLGRDQNERDKDREKERERDELRDLKDRHTTEMGALLGALSDSQRTVRMLREENTELRDRLDRVMRAEMENEQLRRVCSELRRERGELNRSYNDLRRDMTGMRSASGKSPIGLSSNWNSSSAFRTPIAKQLNGAAPYPRNREDGDKDKLSVPLDHEPASFSLDVTHDNEDSNDDDAHPVSAVLISSSPPKTSRRLSTTSSIFPIPPSNMSMLLNEDPGIDSNSNRSSVDHFRFSSGISPSQSPMHKPSQSISRLQSSPFNPRGANGGGHHAQSLSFSSANNISPTTANFSFSTGSPGSLCLRPEHEILLGEMESLDLGARLDVDHELGLVANTDGW